MFHEQGNPIDLGVPSSKYRKINFARIRRTLANIV